MSIVEVIPPTIKTTITAPIPNKISILTLVPSYPTNEIAELTKWSTNICSEKIVKVCFPLLAKRRPILRLLKVFLSILIKVSPKCLLRKLARWNDHKFE